jgi:peptide/nickel transport system permease protein
MKATRVVRSWGVVTWIGAVCALMFVLVATVGQLHGDPTAIVAIGPEPPSWAHPFGTDHLGRDLLARTADAAWLSALVSAVAIGLSLAIATPLGVLAGWRAGRRSDGVIMRTLETAQALPTFVLVIFLLSVMGAGTTGFGPLSLSPEVKIALCLAIGFLPFFTRIARAATISERQLDYVVGLRALGVPTREILTREVGVNIAPVLLVQALLAMAIAIFAEGGLSFLGLGVAAPQATLGNLVADASAQIIDGFWWYATLPGIVLVIGILACNLLGDALNDSLLGADSLRGEA